MKIIFHFDGKKKEEFIINKNSALIGRSKDCDASLPYEGFSRRHALVELIEGEFFITDLNSTNGVLIEGEKIPASKRIPIKTFLTLQIGTASRVEVMEEVAPQNRGIQLPDKTLGEPRPKREGAVGTSSLTRAIRMPSPKKVAPESEVKNYLKIAFVPALILGVAIYFSMNGGENSNQGDSSVVVPKEKRKGPPLVEVNFLPKPRLMMAQREIKCIEKMAEWCKQGGLEVTNGEGVFPLNRSLIIYMNMSALLSTKYSPAFDNLNVVEKIKILGLRRIFSSNLLSSLTSQTDYDNIQIIGYAKSEGPQPTRIVIKIRRDVDLGSLDRNSLNTLFNDILQQGQADKLSQLSGAYEQIVLN